MTAPFADMSADEAVDFMKSPRNQRILDVMAGRVGTGTVVDVGCGRGLTLAPCSSCGKPRFSPTQYLGLDCSPNLLKVAQRDYPDHTFSLRDLRQPFPVSERADFAIIKSVLEHQETIEDALAIYDNALNMAKTVLVGWHMPPLYDETEILTVQACDIIEPLYQNQYKKGSFSRADVHVDVEQVDNFTLWAASRH